MVLKRTIVIVLSLIFVLLDLALLCPSTLVRTYAYEVNNGAVVGEDAKFYCINSDLYVVSSNEEKIVLSKIAQNESSIIKEFKKEKDSKAEQSFYGSTVVGNNFYTICSFKYSEDNNKVKITKYSIDTKEENSFTIIGNFIEDSKSYAFLGEDNLLLLDSYDKTYLTLYRNMFSSPEEMSLNISVKYIESVKQDLSGNRAYIIGNNSQYKYCFISLTMEGENFTENSAGIYIDNEYNFLNDDLIVDSDNKFYASDDGKFSYKFNSYSKDNNMKTTIFNGYIMLTMGNGLIYAIDPATNEAKYQLNLKKDIVNIGSDSTNLFVLYKENDVYYVNTFSFQNLENIKPITYNSGIDMKTEEEIKTLYSASKPFNDSMDNIYLDNADLENFSTPGHIGNIVVDDGLKAINFYRELYNMQKLDLDNNLSNNAQYGSVLALVTPDLTAPSKPENMSDEFYNNAMMVLNKNCIKISETKTESPLADAVHSLFSSNYYFREKVLDGTITKIGFGVCSNSDGKTAVLISFEDKEKYFNNYNFTPYLCEGLYPGNLLQPNSVFSIKLGESLFAGDRGNPTVSITNTKTDEKFELVVGEDFDIIDNNRGILIYNVGFDIDEDSDFKVNVYNLYDENGIAAACEYFTDLFEIKDNTEPDSPGEPIEPVEPSNPNDSGDNNPSKAPDDVEVPIDSDITSSAYKLDKKNMIITGIEPGTTISEIKKNISYEGYTLKILDYKGNEIKSGNIGTSARLQFFKDSKMIYDFHVIIFGELTGEGNLNSRDITKLYNHLLGETKLEGDFLIAVDADHNGVVNTLDLLRISEYIKGEKKITQSN